MQTNSTNICRILLLNCFFYWNFYPYEIFIATPSAAPHFAVLTDLDDATLVSMPYCCIDAFLTFFFSPE